MSVAASVPLTGGAELWLPAALVTLAAGYVQGFTGMGFAVVSTPLLILILGQPHPVVMLSLLLGSVLGAAVLVETRKSLNLRRVWPLILGALLGTPLGVLVLSHTNPRALTVFIAITTLITAAVGFVRLPKPVRYERSAVSIAGVLGGFLNGATSIGGPPPALVVSMQRWEISEGRSALTVFNLTSYLIALATGMTSTDAGFVVRGVGLLPLAVAGGVLGAWSVRRVPPLAFRYALFGTISLAGVAALVSAIW